MRYFKLVATYPGKEDWMHDEFRQGRLHYGWGWPDCELTKVREMSKTERSDNQALAWRHSQFLIQRLEKGDRVIVQLEQPLRKFLIGEVIGEYTFQEEPGEDFNHIIPVRPICENFINVDSKIVPSYLRKALVKRGNYYQIYPQDAIDELNTIINNQRWNEDEHLQKRSFEDDLLDAKENLLEATKVAISKYWKSKDFERFTAALLATVPGISVKREQDNFKGWDLLIQISDILTDQVIKDDIPVQCKAYEGDVNTFKPIHDIIRAMKYLNSSLGYIVITGTLSDSFEAEIINAEDKLSEELGKEVEIKIVDESTLAGLAITYGFFNNG